MLDVQRRKSRTDAHARLGDACPVVEEQHALGRGAARAHRRQGQRGRSRGRRGVGARPRSPAMHGKVAVVVDRPRRHSTRSRSPVPRCAKDLTNCRSPRWPSYPSSRTSVCHNERTAGRRNVPPILKPEAADSNSEHHACCTCCARRHTSIFSQPGRLPHAGGNACKPAYWAARFVACVPCGFVGLLAGYGRGGAATSFSRGSLGLSGCLAGIGRGCV